MRYLFFIWMMPLFSGMQGSGRYDPTEVKPSSEDDKKIYFGVASYYADKFNGRPTANGEIYDHQKLTAACNILPLGTWIRVTNLRNNKSVIVRTNDRMHPRMKRIVDLSRSAAEKLRYIKRGITQVKVEILQKKERASASTEALNKLFVFSQ